ncbi:50S ribosomal protein L18 [Patescibacteria group bacterium]|nr:MAG: 50S ribosomal protein L18 [Patescibacteria group bacterium]
MKNLSKVKKMRRLRRQRRVRARVRGTALRPRLSVFRSNKFLSAQVVNDDDGRTLCALSTQVLAGRTRREKARELGRRIAAQVKSAGVGRVVFDRGRFLYTGGIRELAEGAREGGLSF